MPCDRFTAARRLINLYLEKVAQHGDVCALTLNDVLHVGHIDAVAHLDLLAEYDRETHREVLQRHGWDEHRAKQLLKAWLAPRGKAVRQ